MSDAKETSESAVFEEGSGPFWYVVGLYRISQTTQSGVVDWLAVIAQCAEEAVILTTCSACHFEESAWPLGACQYLHS